MFKRNFWVLQDTAEEQKSAGAPAAPAAETPQEPSAPVEDAFVDAGSDWAELADDTVAESGEWGEEAPPAIPAEPAAATPAEPAPATPEQLAAEQPLQPEQMAPEAQAQYTPEQRQAAEMAYMGQLERLYTFDEDTALKLQTEPEKVLPALAAKLHLDVMKTVMAQVNGMLPQVMQQQTKVVERETKAQDMFFGQWPQLRGYEKQVLEVGRMYRQMNPNAAPDEAVKRIGEVALAALGLPVAAAPTPPAPPAPQQGFRPSAPGRVNAPSRQPTEWEELLGDDD